MRFLKRKRKITEALIICFIITGHTVFTNDIPTNGSIDTPGDYVITDDNTFTHGINITSSDVNLTNNGTISSINDSSSENNRNNSNGIVVDFRRTGLSINNNGVIIGGLNITTRNLSSSSFSYLSGNGIDGNSENNSGVIIGGLNITTGNSSSNSGSSSYLSGNGIVGDSENNSGVIIGGLNITTGNSSSDSYSYSYSDPDLSGNGIDGNSENNSGVIIGGLNITTGNSSSSSDSYSYSDSRAYSYTDSKSSGNGIVGDSENNSGVIIGGLNITTGNSSSDSSLYSYLDSDSNSSSDSKSLGNGIVGNSENNSGVIIGGLNITTGNSSSSSSSNSSSKSYSKSSGNGIVGDSENNSGVIIGNIKIKTGESSTSMDYIENHFSGNGMVPELIKDVINSGLIAGSESAIALNISKTYTGSISNYGIFAGRQIISDGTEIIKAHDKTNVKSKDLDGFDLGSKYDNHGIEITLNNDEGRTIQSIKNKDNALGAYDETSDTQYIDGIDYTVLNTEIKSSGTDSYKEINSDTSYDKYIINGAGVGSGALTVNSSDVTLTNSIVNGYEKAVTLNGDSSLNATDTIFNGGGIGKWNDKGTGNTTDDTLERSNVIVGGNGNNSLTLAGHSVVNGNVDLGAGDDTLIISTDSQLNGDLDGGSGENDSLVLGDKPFVQSKKDNASTANNLNIFNNINDFENINVKGSVTLYETSKISGTKDIFIAENSTLNLRIDPTIKTDGKITGHALYDSGATVSAYYLTNDDGHTDIEADTSAGTLNLITNGIGRGGIIGMGDTKLDDKLYVRTNSIINSAERVEGSNDINITIDHDLSSIFEATLDPSDPIKPDQPDIPNWITNNQYKKLDLIYKSIVASSDDNINGLYPTVNVDNKSKDEAGENLLLLLNDIFMSNPYGYVARTSKDNMNLFNNIILDNPFRANEENWMVYGGLTFGGDDYDSSYKNYIKGNYYGFDTYGSEVNVDSNTYGGYALAEYGLSKNTTVGFILGGTNNTTNISNGSKIEGDSVYIGSYLKSKINNFDLTAGAGYQFSSFDTTRVARNKYQYNKYEEDLVTNGFNIYTGASYNYALNNKWSLEPKLNLTYNRVIQDSVKEHGTLSIEADQESFNYLDTELEMDLIRKISLNNGEGKLRLGLSYVYALDGSDIDYVTGSYQGGSDFDILVPERDKSIFKIKASYDVEYKSGVIYSIGGAYLPSDNRNEYYASVGVGFKFNNLKDFIPTK